MRSARLTCGSISRPPAISRRCAGCFANIWMLAFGFMPRRPTMRRPISRSGVAEGAQRRIWSAAIASAKGDTSQNVARALLPAINDMIDITTVRTVALHTRMPTAILALLLTAALCSAMTAGYAMAKRGHRSLLHVLLYATSIAMTIYVVLDLEHPRRGLIRLEATEQILEQLRESIR